MTTKHEMELIDSAARAQQVMDEELHGEKMVLNMGPQHPSTHGVLRVVLELDGEEIVNAWPDVGYLHRGDEKIAENMTYTQFIPYTDRLDYLAPLANNVTYAYAVEKLMGMDVPPRCKYIRVICAELARISSHLLGLGSFGMDVGAMTIFLYTFREREKIYDMAECISGARFTTSYTRIGGLAKDMPPEFVPMLRKFLKEFPATIDEVDKLLTRNRIFCERARGIGVLPKDVAIDIGVTGPCLRGSGVDWDIRKSHPYSSYENFDFEVPIGSVGDSYDRYLVRMEEMRQSVRILQQAIDNLPDGPVNSPDAKILLPEQGSRPDEDGGVDPSLHQRHGRHQRASRRNLFLRGESEGRTRFLHRQQRGRYAASPEDSRAIVCEPAGVTHHGQRPHDERHGHHPRQRRFRDGRV